MASAKLRRLYQRERANPRSCRVGFSAVDDYRHAVIQRKWDALEDMGLVRFENPPDDCPDLSFLDDWNETRGDIASAKRTREIANDEGVYGLIGEYRLSEDHEWEQGGGVWGFIGYDDADPGRNCYAPQIMEETIEAFRDAWKAHVQRERDRRAGRCPQCHGSGHVA
jgi:hypothetical protein